MPLSQEALAKILASGYGWFQCIPRYRMGDEVISFAVGAHPRNTSLRDVFEKVVLVNSIYGTNIYNPFKMAEHAHLLSVDSKIRRGDISVVDDLRRGHGLLRQNGTEWDFYSFATKYSSWHSPELFPIYDGLVKRLLPKLNRTFRFHARFTQGDLDDYSTLKAVIDSLSDFTRLQHLRYKKIDKGLWIYAKYLYRHNELPNEITTEIENVASVA